MSPDQPISEDDLQAYVDGALDAERHAQVALYLDAHPDAAVRVSGFSAQRRALRALLEPVAREAVPPALNLRHVVEARRPGSSPSWRYAAAAAVLLAVGGLGGWQGRGLSEPGGGLAALMREASENYAVYVPDTLRPVEIKATDRADLAAWMALRLDRRVHAPDLAASGYRFMGGRVVATSHGPAGFFMYDDDHGTRLVMLVRSMAQREASMREQSDGPVAGYSWVHDGLGYSLVGAADPKVLHPIANEIRRQAASNT